MQRIFGIFSVLFAAFWHWIWDGIKGMVFDRGVSMATPLIGPITQDHVIIWLPTIVSLSIGGLLLWKTRHKNNTKTIPTSENFELRLTTRIYVDRGGSHAIDMYITNGSARDILIQDMGIYYYMIKKERLKQGDDYIKLCINLSFHDIIFDLAFGETSNGLPPAVYVDEGILVSFARPFSATNSAGNTAKRNFYISTTATKNIVARFSTEALRDGYNIAVICQLFKIIDSSGSLVTVICPGAYLEEVYVNGNLGKITSSQYATHTLLPMFSDAQCSYSKV